LFNGTPRAVPDNFSHLSSCHIITTLSTIKTHPIGSHLALPPHPTQAAGAFLIIAQHHIAVYCGMAAQGAFFNQHGTLFLLAVVAIYSGMATAQVTH
jgi:hypothetical protein